MKWGWCHGSFEDNELRAGVRLTQSHIPWLWWRISGPRLPSQAASCVANTYWAPAVCRMQWCSNLPLCSLSHAVPFVCLAQFAPFFWVIITGLPRYRSHHSSEELSLSPCLPGHSLYSMPFLGALEHYVGIFVIALILCLIWRSSVSLLSAFSLVYKSWKVQAYFYLSLYPSFFTIPDA